MYLSDEKIAQSLKKGKEWAFRMLFDKYHKKLYLFSKKMGQSHHDAESVVQDVFIIAWKRRASINEDLSLVAWLFTITKRLIIKKIKRKALEDDYIIKQQSLQATYHHQTEDYIIFTNLLDQANEGISKLSSGRKQIFMLSKQQGLSNDEIAEHLNISKRTVENQLYRATKELRDYMGPDLKEK